MTQLSAAAVADLAYKAGFRGESLNIAVAVAHAESGFRTDARGDVHLADDKWGSSIGLWQIRSLRAHAGTGKERDDGALLDPAFNARSAYSISGGGTSFKPWTMYTNGAYKQYMAEARAATSTVGGVSGQGQVAPASTPVLANLPTSIGPHLPVRLGGVQVAGELGNALVDGRVDFTTSKVSEVTLEFADPKSVLVGRYRMNVGSPVDTYGLGFEVVEIGSKQGPGGAHIVLQCHPRGAVRMRGTSPSAASQISPTEYMEACAKAAGLKFVGEPTGKRDTIGPTTVTETVGLIKVTRPQNAMEVGEYWAKQLGFLAFEAAGTYYFASPLFLTTKAPGVHLAYGDAYPGGAVRVPVLEVPVCKASKRVFHRQGEVIPGPNGTSTTYLGSVDYLADVSLRAKVQRQTGERLRPAMAVAFTGLPPFDGTGLLMTRVSWSLRDLTSPVEVEASAATTLAAEGRTPDDDAAMRAATGVGVVTLGTKMAMDMVTFALRQVGDAYVWGAETDALDPDPTAFDCSELVQWACAQAGVKFVDGSSAQIAACRPITVAEASRKRGALLWHPGHIAISLGDGTHTVEAKGRKYGVVEGTIAGRFSKGGLIPGLSYG